MLRGYGYSSLSGGGDVTPITHFPPMFSIILALIGLAKVDLLYTIRLVALLLYGFNAMLVGISLLVTTRRYLIALLGTFLFATSGIFLGVYSMLMSEPLFITFGLLSSLCMSLFFYLKQRRWLFIAGLLAGCAALTRYAGLALFLTAVLMIIVMRRRPTVILMDALLYLSGALPPTIAWNLRNLLLSGTAANRRLLWHPPAWSKVEFGLYNFLDWLFPDRIVTWLHDQQWAAFSFTAVLSLAFLGFVIYTWVQLYQQPPSDRLIEAGESLYLYNLIYVIVYIVSILAAMTLFDASTLFENRILAPAEVSFLIAFLALISRWIDNRKIILKVGVIAVLLVFALFWAQDGGELWTCYGRMGRVLPAYPGVIRPQLNISEIFRPIKLFILTKTQEFSC